MAIRHLGIDPRRLAVHSGFAVFESLLDWRPQRTHRTDSRLGFPCDCGLRQELVPFRVGTIAGLFFGFAFGMGGMGAALIGEFADLTSVQFVFEVFSWLPAIGLLAAFLPRIGPPALSVRLLQADPGRDVDGREARG
jgi:hypothetical protein